MTENGELEGRRERRLAAELRKILSRKIRELLEEHLHLESEIRKWAGELVTGASAPYRLINSKIEEFKENLQ
jgi:hypothetical protein